MSKKKGIIIASVLAVVLAAASVVTYSVANLGNADPNASIEVDQDLSQLGAPGTMLDYMSNIDLIIEDSNKAAPDYKQYKIVELYAGSPSGLGSYVSKGLFEKLVINNNSTSDPKQNMAADSIVFNSFAINSSSALDQVVSGTDTLQTFLDDADLIYVHSPAYGSFDGTNNMPEKIYNYLNVYAGTKGKAIILDYVKSSDNGNTITGSKKYDDLIGTIKNNFIRFRTFAWNSSTTTSTQFINREGSYYLTFNTNSVTPTGKVLFIGANGDGIYKKLGGNNGAIASNLATPNTFYYGKKIPDATTLSSRITVVAPGDVTASALDGYDFIFIDTSAKNVTISADVYNKLKSLSEASKYIIFDSSLDSSSSSSGGGGDISVSANNYLKLMNNYISTKGIAKAGNVFTSTPDMFNSLSAAGDSGQATADSIAAVINAADYNGNGITGKGGKKYRVLEIQPCYPVDTNRALKDNKVMNKSLGVYQEMTKGNYYTKPAEMSFNDKDNVDADAEYYPFELTKAKIVYAYNSFVNVNNNGIGTLSPNQVVVDHMSTEEFICSKKVVLDNYDLVYIGGNVTALKPYYLYQYRTDGGNSLDILNSSAKNALTCFQMYTHTGMLCMYSTQQSDNKTMAANLGNDFVAYMGDSGVTYTKGNQMVELNGNDITTIKLQELNDYVDAGMPIVFDYDVTKQVEELHSMNRLQRMNARYIDPDSNMYKFLEGVYSSKCLDSDGKKDLRVTPKNILWGKDFSIEYPLPAVGLGTGGAVQDALNAKNAFIERTETNNEDMYGSSLSGAVTVFTDNKESDVKQAITGLTNTLVTYNNESTGSAPSTTTVVKDDLSSRVYSLTELNKSLGEVMLSGKERPSLVLTKSPLEYIEGNKASYNKPKEKLNVTAYAKMPTNPSSKVRIELMIDKNGDSDFGDEGESVASSEYSYSEDENGTAKTVSLEYEDQEEDFFGLIHWQVKATEVAGDGIKPSTITEGFAYIPREDQDKKKVRILQIMPKSGVESTMDFDDDGIYKNLAPNTGSNDGQDDGHSLYLCSECQQALIRAHHNIQCGGSDLMRNTYGFRQYTNGTGSGSVDIGLHEHKFAIARFESSYAGDSADLPGNEDWEDNLAEVLEDDYEFDLDILLVSEFEKYVAAAKTSTDTDQEEAKEKMMQFGGADGTGGRIATDLAKAEAYETELNKQLRAVIGQTGYSYMKGGKLIQGQPMPKEYIEDIISTKEYYRFFSYNDSETGGAAKLAGNGALVKAFTNYQTAYDQVVRDRQSYKHYAKLAYDADMWIKNNYDIIVLGFADDFAGMGFTTDACDQIKTYISKEGFMLNTHDSVSRYGSGSGTYGDRIGNIATNLRRTFGMDRFHYTGINKNPKEITGFDAAEQSFALKVANKGNGYSGKAVKVTFDSTDATVNVLGNDIWNISAGVNAGAAHDVQENMTITVDWSGSGLIDVAGVALYEITGESWGNITVGSQVYSANAPTDGSKQITFSIPMLPAGASGAVDTTSVCKYRRFTTEDASKYYWTWRTNLTDLIKWQSNLNAGGWFASGTIAYNLPIGTTDIYTQMDGASMGGAYTYGQYSATAAFGYNQAVSLQWQESDDSYGQGGKVHKGTNGASQNNKGIVTQYPFTINNELRISPTHPQAFALDMEEEDIAVWYSLSGGAFRTGKMGASPFAASPHDGLDNYFIYSYKNVTYSGAGHAVITGPGHDNNDERRLFINVIVNSVRNTNGKPKIFVYEKKEMNDKGQEEVTITADKTKGRIFLDKTGSADYVYNVYEKEEGPEFDFKVKTSSIASLGEVLVYYDLNYGLPASVGGDMDDNFANDDKHVLIASYNAKVYYCTDCGAGFTGACPTVKFECPHCKKMVDGRVASMKLNPGQRKQSDVEYGDALKSGALKHLKDTIKLDGENAPILDADGNEQENTVDAYRRLRLKLDYFAPYGSYTYIVIKATDSLGKTRYTRIKINLIPKLFDLTMNDGTDLDYYYRLVDDYDTRKYNL